MITEIQKNIIINKIMPYNPVKIGIFGSAARDENIGEASANISDDIKQNYPDVSWKEMKGMRNFVVHKYFGAELSDVWNTVTNDIPLLKNQI